MMVISVIIILSAQGYIIKEKKVAEGGGGLVMKKPDALLLRISLIAFLGMMAEGCMFDWSGVYFKKVVQSDPSLIALGYRSYISDYSRFYFRVLIGRTWSSLDYSAFI